MMLALKKKKKRFTRVLDGMEVPRHYHTLTHTQFFFIERFQSAAFAPPLSSRPVSLLD